MKSPPEFRATYRIQLRDGVGFADVERQLSYFAGLGISHLYLSPIFAAVPGSTHGYDTTDFSIIDPSLGGRSGFEKLSRAAQGHGLGILLDFVPNHMATVYENPAWRDTLEWGPRTACPIAFDIDWSAPRLLLPVLGESLDDALANARFALEWEDGRLRLVYAGGLRLPLSPRSYMRLLAQSGHPGLASLAERFAAATPQSWENDRKTLAHVLENGDAHAAFARTLRDAASGETLRAILAEQVWRIEDWHAACHSLTYRRFFEIAGLVGVKVEEDEVFAAVHCALLNLAHEGFVHGLRIDHIDGLRDPKSYLERLRSALPPSVPIYVEKILGPGEQLRRDWPVSGTTGYEFIGALAGLFVVSQSEAALTAAHGDFTGWREPYSTALGRTKVEIVTRNLASELNQLAKLAAGIEGAPPEPRARDAIVALAAELPVYRTYIAKGGIADEDAAIVRQAADAAKRRASVPEEDVTWIANVLCDTRHAPSRSFTGRFQQTTGALMAKSLEDTLFYRYNRLIALNEVGGDPERFGAAPADFHAAMDQREYRQPCGLLATATHDTKRGEDARARLYALTTHADAWRSAVARWRTFNAHLRETGGAKSMPSAEDEYLFYQSLIGAWPLGDSGAGLSDLANRMAAFMTKAAREAKMATSWLAPNSDYESRLDAFVRKSLDPRQSPKFLDDLAAFCRKIAIAGACIGLSQLALKLTAPGVPDIYRGCEIWDFSLVDPDNRRPFDGGAVAALCEYAMRTPIPTLASEWQSGALKLRILHDVLHARMRYLEAFQGVYRPLAITGKRSSQALAGLRVTPNAALLFIVTIRAGNEIAEAATPRLPPSLWADTRVEIEPSLARCHWRDIVTGRRYESVAGFSLSDVLRDLPIAILIGTPEPASGVKSTPYA